MFGYSTLHDSRIDNYWKSGEIFFEKSDHNRVISKVRKARQLDPTTYH